MLANKLLAASGGVDTLFVDDVFSAFTRTGTGGSVVTTTNIDMTKGYMLWTKGRSSSTDHAIYDSARGVTFDLASNLTTGQTTQVTGLTAVSATGHTIGSLAKMNTSAATYVDWVFRKAPKFFDVITYTGNGVNRTVSHSLGSVPGMIIIHRTDSNGNNWATYHRSAGNTNFLDLSSSSASAASIGYWNNTTPTATEFTVGTNGNVNTSGATYVAYLYAHDTSAEGIVQCGGFTTDGSGNATVNLGFEPQYVLSKSANGNSFWQVINSACGFTATGTDSRRLFPNQNWQEDINAFNVNSVGFKTVAGAINNSEAYIYMAIRRPNKPPTLGTQVYNAVVRAGTGSAASITSIGFPPDLILSHSTNVGTNNVGANDRLRGAPQFLSTNTVNAEAPISGTLVSFDQGGFSVGSTASGPFNISGQTNVNWNFKRAPGVFDEVCYTGTGVRPLQLAHNLSAIPELMIVKRRNDPGGWFVYAAFLGNTRYLQLNLTAVPLTSVSAWSNTTPTSSVFTVGDFNDVNGSSFSTYVAYLFASKAGISKVGSYTGNGSSQTINAGFTTGARFILIKRTDSTGDWYVWDTARGIVAGNDPHLSLNTTAIEVTTDDSIDPHISGFIVNQLGATDINVSAGTYIYLSFA